MFSSKLLPTLLVAGLVAVSGYHSVSDPIRTSSLDGSSFANIDFIRTVDFNLTMKVDFDRQFITANNLITLKAVQDVSEIVLDYQGLKINSAQYSIVGMHSNGTWVTAYFETQEDDQLGNALIVFMTDKAKPNDTVLLSIDYETTNESLSFNWLQKEQTASQTLKYLYTKCEPIHCRAIAPLQDTPTIKTTYSA